MSRSRRQSSAGFTLLELLLVVAILAILMGVCVPGLRAAREGYSLQAAGFSVEAKLNEARTSALKRNRQTWLLLDGTAHSLLVQTTGAGGAIVDLGELEMLDGVVLDGLGGPTGTIVFDALGRPTVAPRTIQLRSRWSTRIRTVTVASTGRITVQ
jgi:prepilin-type N-terminal cleavage/methylation domain-containing protein